VWSIKSCGFPERGLAMLTGVLRGTGTQAIGAVMSFVTFWVIGLPLSYALAFKLRWGMVGLWVARATVTTLQVGVYMQQNRAFQSAESKLVKVASREGLAFSGCAETPSQRYRAGFDLLSVIRLQGGVCLLNDRAFRSAPRRSQIV
jgi:hypothetical protein